MRQFITNKRLLLSLADAGSRLMYSIKDVNTLTGYTDRVFNLLTQLHRVHALSLIMVTRMVTLISKVLFKTITLMDYDLKILGLLFQLPKDQNMHHWLTI